MEQINLLPSFETPILPDMTMEAGYGKDTSDYLSNISVIAADTFKDDPGVVPAEAPAAPVYVSSETSENQVRKTLSNKEALEQNRNFNVFLTEKIGQGASAIEMEGYLKAKPSLIDQDKSVIERRAAKWLVDQGLKSPERTSVIINEGFDADTSKTDMRQDYVATMLRLNTLKTRFTEQLTKESIPENIVDLSAILLVPFHTTISAGIKDRQIETLGGKVFRGVQEFWALPVDKRMAAIAAFEDDLKNNAIFGQNTFKAIEQIQQLIDGKSEDGFLYSLTEAIDSLPFLGGLVKGLRLLKTASGATRVAGAKDASVARVVKLKENEAQGRVLSVADEDEMIDGVMPSSATEGATSASIYVGEKPVGLAHKTLEDIAVLKEWEKSLPTLIKEAEKLGVKIPIEDVDPAKLLDVLKDTPVPSVLRSNEQINNNMYAVKALLGRVGIKTEHPSRYPLYDVSISNINGVPTVNIYLGHGESKLKGFQSEGGAHLGAKRLGLEKGFYSISDKSGEFFIKISKEAGSTSFITPTKEKPYVLPFIGRWMQGSTTIMDEDAKEGARLAVLASSKINKAITKSVDNISSLRSNSKETYDALMLDIQQENKWKSMSDVFDWYRTNYQRDPFEKEVKAYLATRHVHKFDWLVKDAAVHREFSRAGFEEILFKPQFSKEIGGMNNTAIQNIKLGKVVTTTSVEPNLVKIVDMTDEGRVVNVVDRTALKTRLDRSEGSVLVKLLSEDKQLGHYVIVKQSDINIRPLREKLLNEIDGPHRIYDTGVAGGFIKQQKIRFINGVATLVSPKTHFAINSGADGIRFAEEYSTALKAFKSIRSNASAVEKTKVGDVISSLTRFSGYDEMAAAIKSGKMERTPFEFVRPGEKPSYKMENTRVFDAIDPDFKNFSSSVLDAIENGRLFYSERGERLLHPKEGMALLLKPNEILKTAINNVVNTQSFSNYKVRQIDKWIKEYGKYLVGMEDRSNVERFMLGQFDKSPNAAFPIKEPVMRSAEAQRLSLQRMLNQYGDAQFEASKWRDHLVGYIEGKTSYSVAKASADILSSNPLLFARGVAFHAFLGMGDISQVVVQLSMLPGMLAASPVHGTKALTSYPFIRAALFNAKHDDYIANLYTKFSFGKGFTPDAFKAMLKDIRRGGIDIVDGNIAELDNLTSAGNLPGFMSNVARKGINALAAPFNEGEKANRVIGFAVAWAENFAKTGKGISTSEEYGMIARRGNTFAQNMVKDGKSWWQEGWRSLPAQFMGHPVRVAELLFHPSAGFTPAERARYYSALALTYGPLLGAGGPAVEYFRQKYFEATGSEPNEAAVKTFTGGMLGLLFPDTDTFRLQPFGQGFPGAGFFDDKGINVSDFLGPAGELGNRFFDSTIGSYKLHALITGQLKSGLAMPTTLEIANDIFKNISSYNRIDKAITMAQTGKLYTNRGMLKQEHLTMADSSMMALGFPPIESREARYAQLLLEDVEKKVFKDATEATQFLIKAWNFPDNSEGFKKNLAYFEYIRDLNVEGDLTGNGGKTFTETVEKLIRKHKAYNDSVAIKFQRLFGRTREDLTRKQ